ncbi:hypothetical protein MTR67_009043 [Solanum verrucosum]|uniref:Uncharacterized protein n=1 Tax=Solanum verrucosum TaxID=315347 RepID=A0AAF0Q370_SOLVR|nr:hypothetical protein MTR67_009043 [Solanum verrucosum]
MADPELEAIRQRRMQELMAQQGVGTQQNTDQQKSQDDAKREADERRQMMLTQILTSEARAREVTSSTTSNSAAEFIALDI